MWPASLGVWPLGAFAWCVRPAHTAPFRTRSLRAAILTSRLPPTRSLTDAVPLPVTPVSAHAQLCTPQRLVRFKAVGWCECYGCPALE